jgi:hypothetical protein
MIRKYTLVVRGDTEEAFDEALEEATRLMNESYHAGHDTNESGAFYFGSTADVPQEERPR